MHAHCVWPGKKRTRLPVFKGAVGENQGVMGCESFFDNSSLTYVAVSYYSTGVYGTILYYEIVGIHAGSDSRKSSAMGGIVDYHAVAETAGSLYLDFRSDGYIEYSAAVAYHCSVSYGSVNGENC